MKTNTRIRWITTLAFACILVFLPIPELSAHCDGIDGPVVKAAQRALAENNVNLVLIWVQKDDDAEIKRVFEQTLGVRKLSPQARELADRYFFETLVRIHRAGEGAPYTGLKAAGRDLGAAIPAGDKALETGKLAPLTDLLATGVKSGLNEHFNAAMGKKKFAANDVAAGRAFVKEYVTYIHYVEGVHQAIAGASHGHPGDADEAHGHKAEAGH
jgi:hypothetical protein